MSRVLNDSPRVDPRTRARVLAAIEELRYTPSVTARRLSLGHTSTIGVIVPFLTRPSMVERLRGVAAALVEAGYDLIVFNVETIERRDQVYRDVLQPARIDGLIVISLPPRDAELARLRRQGIPVVLVDAYHRTVDRVVTDDVMGGRIVASHLLDLGHRRIGFVGDPPRTRFGFSSSRLRFQGFRSVLQSRGIVLDGLVETAEHGRVQAAECAERLLRRSRAPTAIFAASDTQAFGVLEAAAAAGRSVPGDLSVVGYDDIEIAAFVGLTTIRQPLAASGAGGVTRLLELIERRPPGSRRRILPVELVERRTTGPAPD